MDNDSVAMFLTEEPERKRQSCKPGRRFFCILALVAFLTLTVLFSVVLSLSVINTNRYESLKTQYDEMRNEGKIEYSGSNIGLNTFIDNRINNSEFTWKHVIDARLGSVDNRLRNQVKADKKLRSHMNNSFENITNDVENLLSEVDNLTLSVLRINTTSDEQIRHLRNILKGIEGDLSLTRTALRQINGSLGDDLMQVRKSLNSAVKGLKNGLMSLTNATTAKANELWRHWNQTNTDFQQALIQMSHHNTTFHLIVEYHRDALKNEVKILEKKLAQLSNKTIILTTKDKQNLKKELNKTRRILKEAFQNEMTRSSTSLSKKIEGVETQLKSSLANVKTKIDAVKNQLQTNITNLKVKQKDIKDDLSKTKLNLQGVDSRQETKISALVAKIENVTNKYEHLKDNMNNEKNKRLNLEKELQDLRDVVEKLQNKANGILRMNVPFVVSLVSFILVYI